MIACSASCTWKRLVSTILAFFIITGTAIAAPPTPKGGLRRPWRPVMPRHADRFRKLTPFVEMPILILREIPKEKTFTNSIGMKFARIEPDSFIMGNKRILSERVSNVTELIDTRRHLNMFRFAPAGDFDEQPVHHVTITKPFYMGMTEVTNTQYEKFDPRHMLLRGKNAHSIDHNEAVIYVSWHDAKAFCAWLSKKEGLPYRLPTEAEWEYACRAGTQSGFWDGPDGRTSGDGTPKGRIKNPNNVWFPDVFRGQGRKDLCLLHVAKLKPNPWGLYDMHGNVEEWCEDWYGPYLRDNYKDPVGYADGDFKVTRGGSHSTVAFYLRSANRMGTLPEDKHHMIGFRVVLGEMPKTKPLPVPAPPANQRNVKQGVPADILKGPDPKKPYFAEPREFVTIHENESGPLFGKHNHCPAVTECPNGDILAIWYSTVTERGRELVIAANRLRWGNKDWDKATPFWDAPDRNDHTSDVWWDGKKTIYHFNGLSTAATWGPLAIIMRTSTDSGATWSKARLIQPEHHDRRMVIASTFRSKEGYIVLPCDATPSSGGGSLVHISKDQGKTWYDSGGTTRGIHAGVAQLTDGRLIALGRSDPVINERGIGRMPTSISVDMGRTWTYSASPFPRVSGGQRPVLRRLKEGPLLLVSFAWSTDPEPVAVTDTSGKKRIISGMFAALSYDDGATWPVARLVSTDPAVPRKYPGKNIEMFTMSRSTAEGGGYLTATQARNGVIHLLSSRLHYAFNLKWLQTPPPPVE